MKKNLTIVALVFFTLLAITGIAWWFFASTNSSLSGSGGFFGSSDPFVDENGQGNVLVGDEDFTDTSDVPEEFGGGILQHITQTPVAGVVYDNGKVWYVERASGNIYTYNPDTKIKTRITNTTIPGVREVVWGKDKSNLIIRYLESGGNIKTYVGDIIKNNDGNGEFVGSFVEDGLEEIVSNNADEIIFLRPESRGATIIKADISGSNQEVIFETPFGEWDLQWFSDKNILITTKASGWAYGSSYFLNIDTNKLSLVLGGVVGLTTKIHPSGETLMYTQTESGSVGTYTFYEPENLRQKLSIKTFVEKCVWSKVEENKLYCAVPKSIPKGLYPDIWYKGLVSFSDNIWEIDTTTNTGNLVLDPTQHNVSVDIINPLLDDADSTFYFNDKKTGDLWSISL